MMAMEYSYATAPQGDFIDNMSCTRVINWYDAVNLCNASATEGSILLHHQEEHRTPQIKYIRKKQGEKTMGVWYLIEIFKILFS